VKSKKLPKKKKKGKRKIKSLPKITEEEKYDPNNN